MEGNALTRRDLGDVAASKRSVTVHFPGTTLRRNPLWPCRPQGRCLQREALWVKCTPHAAPARALLLLVGWGLNTRNTVLDGAKAAFRQRYEPLKGKYAKTIERPAAIYPSSLATISAVHYPTAW